MFNKLFISISMAFAILFASAFASENLTCGLCDGKVSELTLQYNGDKDATVKVKARSGEQLFDEMVSPNDKFVLSGFDKQGTLGTEVTLFTDGQENARIHTSCSVPILSGMKFGAFTIKEGYSRNGGALCQVEEESEPELAPTCSECDGKITTLTLQSKLDRSALIEVYGLKGDLVFRGTVSKYDFFTLNGYDNKGTLGPKVNVYVDGVFDTEIHTSCSVAILVGMEFGSFTIRKGASRNGGATCSVPGYTKVGHLCGKIYEDKNLNEKQEIDEKANSNISLAITDAKGSIHYTSPDVNGDYCVYTIPVGQASVSVDKATLPLGTLLMSGANPNSAFVIENTTSDAGTDTYAYAKPDAYDSNFTTIEDTPFDLTLKADDIINRPLTYTLLTQPQNGTLSGTAPNLAYTPTPNYNGSDSFTFKVNNGILDSETATVNIKILPTNDAPVAVDDNATVNQDENVTIDVLANDSDSDDNINPDTLTLLTSPGHGKVSIVDHKVFYTPNEGYSGEDNFTYLISDGVEESNIATVSITVIKEKVLDCSENTIPNEALNPVVKWHWNAKNATSYTGYDNPYNAPVVVRVQDDNHDGKINQLDTPSVLFHEYQTWGGGSVLRAVNGATGQEIWTNNEVFLSLYSDIAAGDIDNDGYVEIVAISSDGYLCAIDHNGKLKWKSSQKINLSDSSIAINDIDSDGSPEIIIGNIVFDNHGKFLWQGTGYKGVNKQARAATSIVADINFDNYSEIIAGPTVYDHKGNILWSLNIGDGYTAIGNFNHDINPEIVLVTAGKVYLLSSKGDIIWGPVNIPGGGGPFGGGAPTVSDVDGDGEPEIGIAGANYYVVFETDGSVKWTSKTRDYSSAITGSSVFDFNGDGKVEIVYADELTFRIYDGETGNILYSKRNTSGTAKELPVVADVDNDGHANIVFIGNEQIQSPYTPGVNVLKAANDDWMPTRSIWNQHSYHIDNINDDGTIPKIEDPSWLSHNTYRLNTFKVESRCHVAPEAYSDTVTTLENTAAGIKLLGTDKNDDPLTYQITTQPQHGVLSGSGIYLTYIPNPGYVGNDSFTYKVNDGLYDSNEAQISIKVLSSANALAAIDDQASLLEDQNMTIDVLANDTSTTGSYSIAVVVPPHHGSATIVNGKILYSPNKDYSGEDTFYYTYRDSNGFVSNSAMVSLYIESVNDVPVAYDQNITIAEDELKVISLNATDSEGDPLEYSIESYPQHGTLNGVAPSISYTPDANYHGTDSFTFSASDGNSQSNIATVTVNVTGINDAPVAITGEYTNITVGSTLILDGSRSYDVDGEIVSYSWQKDGEVIEENATAVVNDLPVGEHTFVLTVTDDEGLTDSNSVVVRVVSTDSKDIIPPVITVLGENPKKIYIGDAYTDAGATAFDNRDGEVGVGVSYSFSTSVEGTHKVTYTAVDSAGNKAEAYRYVMVVDNTTPDTTAPIITLLGDNPMIIYQGETYSDPGIKVVDDRDVSVGYTTFSNVNSVQVGQYSVTYKATDSAGNSAEASRTVYVKDPSGNRAPEANAGSDIVVSVGESVSLSAALSRDIDGQIIYYEWKEGDTLLSNDITFTMSDLSLGTHEITLTVTDNEEASSTDTVIVRVIDPSDTTPPTASITSPAEDSVVKLQSEIRGTAYDENLDHYELFLSPVGKDEYTSFAKGTASVTDGVLATLDASTIQNGIYDVLLKVIDQNGAISTATTKVRIEGKAKIGNFSFTVTDFDIKVGGLPLQVNRTYSTLQRLQKLDFGYAWSIDYQNVKVEENRNPGREWKVTPDFLVGSCFKFDKSHIVNIALPDGSTESFEFRFENECSHYFTGSFYDAPKLYALNGSTAKLETIDASDTVAMNSSGEIVDSQTMDIYNPSRYRLTLANGMVYEVTEGVGLKLVKDLRGDTLTYSNDGVLSSRGESLTFERDAKGRITKITDLAGKSMTYHYDANDDLDYVIDQLGQKTTYAYQDGHMLEEWFDPSGTRITQNIYDAIGRLIQTIDPDGNVVEFTHDIDGREEIVKDKLGRINLYVYDDNGNVLGVTNPEGETTTRTYDAKGNELTVTDPLGNTITNEYDANGNLLSTTDALGHEEVTTYNTHSSPLSVSDKNGNTMNIVYNDYNAPRSFTTASGVTNTFYYDQFGNKIESINEYGQKTTYVYDSNWIPLFGATKSKGNLLKETRPDGTVIEHTYDESSNMLSTTTTYTKADGTTVTTTVTNTYDDFNRLVSTTDELGNTTTYTYDARGNKVSTTDAQDRVTKYSYTPSNKLTKTEYPDGTVDSKTYDAMDNLLSETNAEGETTSYEYDGADRLTKTTYPDGTYTSTEYDDAGRTISTTDENGNTTSFAYDAAGNRISTTDALGNKTTFTYDAQGNMLSMTDALNQTTTYEYNALNQRVKTIYPDGTTLQEPKNTSGLPSSKIDENGNVTTYGYDTSRMVPLLNQVTLQNGAVTSYGYDSEGKKTSQSDAEGRTTSWSYTDKGQLGSEILPMGESKTFTYDSYGKQTQINDYANKAIKFIYDSYDRLVRTEYADGSTVTYDYTRSGRVKTITDTQGTITNTYDNRGRLKSQTNPSGETITYSYDGVGNINEIVTPTQTISKTYDKLNRLSSVTDAKGTTSYSYDAIGRQTQVTYPNGVTTNYSYDTRNRVTKIEHKDSSGNILQRFAYTLDNVGNRTKIVEHTGRTTDYVYNSVNQLTKETVTNDPNGQNTVTTYSYDLVGNLKIKTIDGVQTDYSYNDNDQLTQQGTSTFTYDANGNLIQKDNTTYTYDDQNRLIKVQTPTDTIEYTYDANNNRIAKTTTAGTTTYLVDTNTPYAQVITESKADGTEIQYIYGNDLISNGDSYFLTDALGSTRGLIDETETLTDTYNYTPYGELKDHTGSSENNFLYTGEQFDPETEDYYLRARYYSPNSARFLSRDTYDGTAGNPITQNHYAYANTNPSMYVDPSGNMGMMSLSANISLRSVVFNSRTMALGKVRSGFMKTFGCDLMTFVVEEGINAGIYLYMADGFRNDAKPYVGKTSRSFRARLKEHLDKSPWKKDTRNKLKSMSHVLKRFDFKIKDDVLLETIEQVILDALGGPEKTANIKNPMGGRKPEMPKNIDKIKKLICKGK